MIDLDIVMLVPGMPFNGSTLGEKSLGGSESAALYMAQALARKGQHVTVFCNTEEPAMDELGVRYMPTPMFPEYARTTQHDVCIIQRLPEGFSNVINSRLNILWCHDLALGRQATTFKSALWNIDAVMVLSDFMAEQYKRVYGVPESLLMRTRNGIDLGAFSFPQPERQDRVFYAARPERGLDILLKDIMPRVWEEEPNIQLRIATYDNPVSHFQEFYRSLRLISDIYGEDKVQWLGALTKQQLYRELAAAKVYVYPTPGNMAREFSEVSCIAAMEAQAAGLPIVTSRRGALPETVHHEAGALVDGDPWTEAYQREFAEAVVHLFRNNVSWGIASSAGQRHAQTLDWDDVADDWVVNFVYMIRKRNDDPERLLRHAWRNSDIMLAHGMLYPSEYDDENEQPPIMSDEALGDMRALIKPFDFAFGTDEDFAAQYAKIGDTHNADVFEYIPNESRFRVLVDWLKTRDDIHSVLDYGCGLGGYAYYGSLQTGKTFTGVDIDPRTIQIARAKSTVQAKVADVTFLVGTHKDTSRFGTHDALVVQELLEHVPRPWEVIDSLEKCLADDGWVYITVPFGPWEYSSYHTYPHRCHIWHFDMHDLRDMFGGKRDFSADALYSGPSPELGTPLGWWVVKYRKNGERTGRIDMNRKRWLQRPRQTVSVSIMAGPDSEDTLHWCMKSFRHVADELILVDNGMGNEARRIAEQYGAFVVEGADPRAVGFEVPRNIGLSRCRMDWVFWIDTDEKLINPVNVHKYLRENSFNGYGIRQHHFACDTTFKPDMPVRFFRNRETSDGSRMRFYGMIHEHPELSLNEGPGEVVVMSDAHLAHVGYLIEGTRQTRFVRNYPLLLKDQEVYPDRILQKHFIMRDNILLCRYELEHNGGRITRDIERRCRDVIDLYRKHFLGKKVYMGADSLQYDSDALSILGEGSEVAFQFDASRESADPTAGAARYRFASREDFVIELTRRVDDKFSLLDDPNY